MASELNGKTCVPCTSQTPTLPLQEIERLLEQLGGDWQLIGEKALTKAYRFKDFLEAVGFVNAITPVAEQEGHHPDLLVTWGRVRVTLQTHVIDGLSENDFILAAKIDQLRRP